MYKSKPKYVFEVINEVKKTKKKSDKISVLKANETWALKDVLKGTLDPKIVWLLPDGKPPYEPSEEHNHPTDLRRENTKFKYLVKGGPAKDMLKVKRENIFLGILEGIHPEDANLLVDMINKKKFGGGITINLVNEAFPNLI